MDEKRGREEVRKRGEKIYSMRHLTDLYVAGAVLQTDW